MLTQELINLGSGDFSSTYNLHNCIFLTPKEAQTTSQHILFQANKLCVGLKSPLP